MRVRELVKKSAPRVDTSYIQPLQIQSYGDDNLYPQIFRYIIRASPVGAECLERFANFIEGDGFSNKELSDMIVNRRGETLDDIHSLLCNDLAYYNGLALHLNYDEKGNIVEIQHVPFENCRLKEPDDTGTVWKIALHPDWTGRKTYNGKCVQVKKENVDYIDVFNPIKEVVLAQIEAAGGIDVYQGQILWLSMNGRFVYPVGKGDKVATEMSTDEGLSNIKYRNTRCNFMPSAMLISKKGASTTNSENGNETISFGDDELHNTLARLQGDTNALKIMEITIEADEEKPELVTLNTQNYDKEFSVTEGSITERIYAAFGQEAWYCLRIGKIGFSGDILSDAFEYYNSVVKKQQRFIQRAFQKIFKHWYKDIRDDFSIEPLKYVKNETNSVTE